MTYLLFLIRLAVEKAPRGKPMIACTYVQLCGHFVRLLVWQDIWHFQRSRQSEDNLAVVYYLAGVSSFSYGPFQRIAKWHFLALEYLQNNERVSIAREPIYAWQLPRDGAHIETSYFSRYS